MENDMTESAKKPIDDSKEELSEAELDQVAGGVRGYKSADLVKKPTEPELTLTHGAAVKKTHPNPDIVGMA
jgi:hypothetical protein